MKRMILHLILMLVAAGLVHVTFRYYICADFQGYLTFPIGGGDFGFAHIKSTTEWVSGMRSQLTPISDLPILIAMLGAMAWLVYEVRMVYKISVKKK